MEGPCRSGGAHTEDGAAWGRSTADAGGLTQPPSQPPVGEQLTTQVGLHSVAFKKPSGNWPRSGPLTADPLWGQCGLKA